jgi:hypothetical protein
VWNRIRINPKLSDCLPGLPIIDGASGGGEEEFRLALRSISLYGDYDGGADQDAVFRFFGNNQCSFFDPKTFAQLRGHNDCASLAYFRRLDIPTHVPDYTICLIFRHIFVWGARIQEWMASREIVSSRDRDCIIQEANRFSPGSYL